MAGPRRPGGRGSSAPGGTPAAQAPWTPPWGVRLTRWATVPGQSPAFLRVRGVRPGASETKAWRGGQVTQAPSTPLLLLRSLTRGELPGEPHGLGEAWGRSSWAGRAPAASAVL